MDPFLGQIICFGGNFAPRGWAFCHGQLLSINENQALFSILGTTYGGDGRTTFGLPDLRGRAPVHAGDGAGLSPRNLGQKFGTETNTLAATNLPGNLPVSIPVGDGDAATDSPSGAFLTSTDNDFYNTASASGEHYGSGAVTTGGGNQALNNMEPFLVINYIIALTGTFPSRN